MQQSTPGSKPPHICRGPCLCVQGSCGKSKIYTKVSHVYGHGFVNHHQQVACPGDQHMQPQEVGVTTPKNVLVFHAAHFDRVIYHN